MLKKGFTLIELLSVIVVLAIIAAIATSSLSRVTYTMGLRAFIANEKIMVNVSKFFLDLEGNYRPTEIGQTIEIKLSLLQDKGFIDDIVNPWNQDDICDGYILVTKVSSSSYDYDPYLKCDVNYKADGYITDALVSFWKFDHNDVYDYTPNNNHGSINNCYTTTNRFGENNSALLFTGPSSYVNTNYDYSINYDSSSAISLWVRPATINTFGKVKNILGKNAWEHLLSQVDNKIHFTLWDSKGDYAIKLISMTSVEVDKWYNIVIVYNGTTKEFLLYINGKLDSSAKTSSTSFVNRNETLKIGRGYPDTGAASSTFYYGTIDNIYIYNRALSLNEIRLNYDIGQMINK